MFETVLSDPVGDEVRFLEEVAGGGYTVLLHYIGVSGPRTCEERVAMRVWKGGHDVPPRKIAERLQRSLHNLAAAVRDLPHVWVFDNGDLRIPFRRVAVFEQGRSKTLQPPVPRWLKAILDRPSRARGTGSRIRPDGEGGAATPAPGPR